MEETLYYYSYKGSFMIMKHELADDELPEGAVVSTKEAYDEFLSAQKTEEAMLRSSPAYVRAREMAQLHRNLDRTDYQAIKYAEGVLTEEEYAPIKAQRQAWRARLNELEAEEDEK